MRKILKALLNALKAMVRGIDGTWRYLFGSGGGDVVIDDDHDAPDPSAEKAVENAGTTPAPDEHALRTDRRRDAALIYTYAGECQLDGVRPAMPPCLPRSVKDWLPGLSTADLKTLTGAGLDGIFSHIGEGPYIHGVHRVQRLHPVPLETAPGPAIEHDDAPRDAAELRMALGF